MNLLKRLAVPLIILGVFGSVVGLAVALRNSQGEDVTKYVGIDQKLGNQVPLDATFKDEAGNQVKLADYFGHKPVVLMLVFYQCRGTCVQELEGAAKSFKDIKADDIGKGYEVVTISIHPKETPQLAAAKKSEMIDVYGRTSGAKGWHFLTGTNEEIHRVAAAVGFRYRYVPVKDQIVHPTGIMVLTPSGRVSQYWYGTEYASKIVYNSIQEAAAERIGVPADPLLMGCYQYDKVTGRTRSTVMTALKISGFATVFIMILSIWNMSKPKRDANSVKEDSGQPKGA